MFWLVLSILLVACVTAAANGQEKTYKQLPFAEAYRLSQEGIETAEARQQNKPIYSAIKNGNKTASSAIESGNAAPAEAFFKEYIRPSMTRTNSKSLSTLGVRRTAFIDDFLSSKTTGGARTAFIKTVIQSMQQLAGAEDFHPAARINAVYVLGLLDSQAAGRDTAAVPSADAFTSLANIFTSNQSPESLKVAAAAGIDRHLQLARAGNASNLGGGDIGKIAQQALAIVNGTANGQADWNEDLDYWLKKRSTKILGLLGQVGNNGEVVQTMIKMLQIEKPSQLWLGFEAMIALGNIDLTSADPALISQASVGVTQFLSAALETQATTTQSSLDSLIYQNILVEDLDLTLKGNDYTEQALTSNREAIVKGNSPKKTSQSSSRGRSGDDFGEDYGDDYGDDYGEDFGGDFSGGGGRGGGSDTKRRPGAPKVEIPTYQLNRVRSMVKALAYGGKRTLAEGTRNLQSAGSDRDKAMISEVVAELNQLITDSDVGITNLADSDLTDEPGGFGDEEEDPPGNTEQMINLCSQASSRLAEIVRTNAPAAGDAAPGDAAVSADQPNF